MPELVDQPNEQPSEALYTVVAGEGDGFMLGMAAGDAAGGAWDLGYSAPTEQATVIAYELIASRELDPGRVVTAFLEMDGVNGDAPVFRGESPELRSWLDRARAGPPVPGEDPSIDSATRTLVIGVAHRREPERVVADAIELGKIFHNHAASVAAGVLSAAAAAASCFAQSGLDLVAGVAESIETVPPGAFDQFDSAARVEGLVAEVSALLDMVGIESGEEAMAAVGGDPDDPIQMTLAGILLAAPVADRHHLAIEQAARIGGSRLGAIVGAIVGARVGIRAWPWAFANDTWFAEIGRRLVRGPDEVRDLPIPYAVEHHLMSGGRPGFH